MPSHNGEMICVPCRKRHHDQCPGRTWCDCQHLPPASQPARGPRE